MAASSGLANKAIELTALRAAAHSQRSEAYDAAGDIDVAAST
jgi:hypothetical protein